MKRSIIAILTISIISVSVIMIVPVSTQSFNLTTKKTQALMDAVPLTEAIRSTKRFRGKSKDLFPNSPVPIKAYLIRGVDLLQALDLDSLIPSNEAKRKAWQDTLAIRVYLGLDSLNKFKIFVVDVDGASFSKNKGGHDRFFLQPGSIHKSKKQLTLSDYMVLDVNNPCPNSCDDNSVLTK